MKLLLLSGLDGTGHLMAGLRAHLGPQVVSEAVTYPPDMILYDDLLDWLAPFLPAGDFVIVAESFSGPLAVEIAARAPVGLRGIIFVATFAQTPRWMPWLLIRVMRYLPYRFRLFAMLGQIVLMGRWSSRRFGAEFYAALTRVTGKTMAGRLEQVVGLAQLDMTGVENLPCLYLCARNDLLVSARNAAPFQCNGCKIHDMDGPHFLLQARPQECAAIIKRFAETLPLHKR